MDRKTVIRLVLLSALLSTTCAMKAAHASAPETQRYILPYGTADEDVLCVQQPSGNWSCIHLGDLRRLLGSMGRA